MPYRQNFRRRPVKRSGRGLKWAGVAARAAPYVARGVAHVARNWKRTQPLTKRLIVGGGAAGAAGAVYSAGKRSGSRVVVAKRQMVNRRTSPGAQLSQADMLSPITIKKSLSNARPLDKRTLKLGFNYRILRWQLVNTMNAATTFPGALKLSHGTINTNQTVVPMILFCLNHTNNQSSLTAGPCWNTIFNDTGGLVLSQLQTQNADNTVTQNKWITEYSAPAMNAGVNDPELRYIMKAWYDIRLNCYGCTSQPTIYDISVVSMVDDYLDPLESPSSSQETSDRHAVWQSLIHRYMSNPIMSVKYPKRKLRYHASAKFTLQPTLNVENDVTPQSRIVKLFLRDNTITDYCYHGDGFTTAGADDNLSTTKFVVQGASSTLDYSDVPAAKVRKWLVIRAMNTTRVAAGSETTANTPSFDILVRSGEYCQAR